MRQRIHDSALYRLRRSGLAGVFALSYCAGASYERIASRFCMSPQRVPMVAKEMGLKRTPKPVKAARPPAPTAPVWSVFPWFEDVRV